MTATATTIVVAREDFSIPGGDEGSGSSREPAELENRFFTLLREARPDAVVLDLSRANGDGAAMIVKVRSQTGAPILVVTGDDPGCAQDYRSAGAAECIPGPVDLVAFNQVLQRITRAEEEAEEATDPAPRSMRGIGGFSFADVSFRPHENVLVAANGRRTRLTATETRLLVRFAARPWEVQTPADLAAALDGDDPQAGGQTVDAAVNQLRGKLRSIGQSTQHLIKLEFRRGYRFVCDAAVEF